MSNKEAKSFFTGNRINNPALADLTSIARLTDAIGKTRMISQFSVGDFENEFLDIAQSGDLIKFILRQAERYAMEDGYSPPVTSPDFVHLLVNDLCQLYIGTLHPQQTARNITFTSPCNFLFAPLSPNVDLYIKKYKLPDDWVNEVFDAGQKLTLVDEFTIGNGECINISRNGPCLESIADGGTQDHFVYDFRVDQPLTWLRLASQAPAKYQWVFDKDTLHPVFLSSSSVAQTRFETIIQMISSFHESGMATEKHADVLESLTLNPLHHIRWQATQVLFDVDHLRAISVIQRLENDAHPHVANAAIASLQQLRQAGLLH